MGENREIGDKLFSFELNSFVWFGIVRFNIASGCMVVYCCMFLFCFVLFCFVCCFVTASFSRSALNFEIEGHTQVSSIIQAFICLLCLFFLMPLLAPLPKCVLASVVATSVHGLIKSGILKFQFLWCVARTELFEFLIAFIAPLIVGLELGLVIGVVASLVAGIYRHSQAKVVELGELQSASDNVEYVSLKHFSQAIPIPDIKIIEMRAELSFTNSR